MLHKKWLLGVLLQSLLLSSCVAVFEVEEMGLRVVYPKEARASYDMALANFGEPIYGGTMMGNLVYPSNDPAYNKVSFKCDAVPCQYGCTFLNESQPPFILKKDPGRRHIMLLDRGPRMDSVLKPCTFLEKVWHAQLAGADAVIYANDKDGGLLTPDIPDDVGLSSILPLIRIPAGFITQQDANQLKQHLKQGPVALVLNWTSILPRAPKVHWEFWTNSNDECGAVCTEQQKFIKDIMTTAITLQKEGHASFSPHYLLWSCPEEYSGSDTCNTQCIRNGTYCCPDPDDNIHQGYSGADVLWMNVRSLCFYRLASSSNKPWMWWEFADKLGEKCSMQALRFMPECAQQVFDELEGPKLADGKGQEEWMKCVGASDRDGQGPIQMLEDELAAQHGDKDSSSSVAILPTIRINGAQYRGTLDSKAVTRALCSAFPVDREPDLCNEERVSENECKPGGVGYNLCHNGTNKAAGRTECINTFSGYECRCGTGFVKMTQPDTGEEFCADVNECLVTNEPQRNPDCSCERCTCINDVGGYRCSGALPNMCTKENKFGGCWQAVIGGKHHHACVDQFSDYKDLATTGALNSTFRTFRCQCPPCFAPTADGKECKQLCGEDKCDAARGVCGAKKASGGGGLGGGMIFLIVLASMVGTAAVVYPVVRWYLRRMREDMRDFMAEYVPLASTEGPRAHGDMREVHDGEEA